MEDDPQITRSIQFYPNAGAYADDPEYRALVVRYIKMTEEAVRHSKDAHAYAMKNPFDTLGRTRRNQRVNELDVERHHLYSAIEAFVKST